MNPALPAVALTFNAALLLLVMLALDLAASHRQVESLLQRRLLMGVVLGGIGIGVMTVPLTLLPGLVFDVRSVLLAISGLFFGIVPTTVAMLLTAAYRLSLGGIAVWSGVAVILASGLIGVAWREWRRPQLDAIDWRELLLLGLLVHLAMLIVLLLMLREIAWEILSQIGLPVMLVHPLLTVALGLLLSRRLAYQLSLRTLRQSEERYHSLFDNDHTAMLIIDPESTAIVAANPAAASYYGWTQEQLTSMRMDRINTLSTAEILAEMDRARARQSNRFEFRHRRADGAVRDVEVFSGPIEVNGRQLLFSIVYDIGERREAEARLAESEARRAAEQAAAFEEQRKGRLAALNLMEDALAARTRAEAALAELRQSRERLKLQASRADALLTLPDTAERMDEKEFMRYGLEQAEQLTGSRIGFIHFVHDDQENIELVTWSRATQELHCQAVHDSHYPISAAGIWADALRRREPVVFNDYAAVPGKRGLPAGHAQLQRLISVPVIEDGLVRMMVGVGNKAQDYDEFDVETVRLLANAIWRLVAQRKTEAALRASETLNRATLDSVVAEIAVLDGDGAITTVNEPWRRFALENGSVPGRPVPGTEVGANYLDACHNVAGPAMEGSHEVCDGIRAVLDGRLLSFHLEYPCHSPDRQRWFSTSVTPLGKERHGAVVAHTDISERRLSEEKISRQLKELRQWYDLTMGRESRVLELKTEVNALLRRLGETPRYASVGTAPGADAALPPTPADRPAQ